MKLALLLASSFVLFTVLRADPPAHYTERLAALQSAFETNRLNAETLFQLGHLCHQQATTGDTAAVKLAERYLSELKRRDPTNAFGRALLGSIIVMKAREAILPTTKLKFVRQGCAEMDAAVATAPTDADVRFTRASNNLFLPDVCGRKEIVRQDMEWLDQQSVAAPRHLPVEFRQYVALYYGLALRKWGDAPGAVAKWKNGITLAAESSVADEIRTAMKSADAAPSK